MEWGSMSIGSPKPRRVNLLIAIFVLIIAMTAGLVYAALFLNVQNSVTINPGIGLATFSTLQPNCPALGDPAYGIVTPYTNKVDWSITAGGSQTEYFCIENQGSGN